MAASRPPRRQPPSPLVDGLLARAHEWQALETQVRRVGGCEQPIRLRGRRDLLDNATGELTEAWSSEELPDGTVLVACGNRRASRCQPCSRLYQGDAYQLVVAGLRGGKGTPEAVADRPALFLTVTAPSFGPVHTLALDDHGRPRTCRHAIGACTHGRPLGCPTRHVPGDPLLGQAICPDCFDYEGAVLWNAHVSELWRRTRIGVYRQLAKLLHRSEARVLDEVRVEYVKVAEYQRRGLLHYHAAVRLDHTADRDLDPPAEYGLDLLAEALTAAVGQASAPYPDLAAPDREPEQPQLLPEAPEPGLLPALDLTDRPALHAARWGEQLHLEPIAPDEADQPLSRGRVAGYLAKYATKHTEALGGLDRRVRLDELATLPVNPHVHRLVVTAVQLGNHLTALGRLRRWAHQLGYGGHWLTKSRRWSTTFTALRRTRRDWQAARNPDPGQDHHGTWHYVTSGYRLTADAHLAQQLREEQALARIELRELRAEEDRQTAIAA